MYSDQDVRLHLQVTAAAQSKQDPVPGGAAVLFTIVFCCKAFDWALLCRCKCLANYSKQKRSVLAVYVCTVHVQQ